MDRMATDARDASVQRAYEILCEWRGVITQKSPGTRVYEVDPSDIGCDALLVLSAIYQGPAHLLMPRLGIDPKAATQAIETLILRGYLEFQENPDNPRRPNIALTEPGNSAVHGVEMAAIERRWAEFPFRPGDIVISTTQKSGTTWMQMICALLIFQSPALPGPLPALSPWLDDSRGRDEIYAALASQSHRRFIKTHMALNEIPIDPRVTYIVVARNLFDLAISWYHQISGITAHLSARKNGGRRPIGSPRQWLVDRIDEMGTDTDKMYSFDTILKNLASAWELRGAPNVVLVHYEDLSADLADEMRRLAGRLGINVPAQKWPSLVQAATFNEMRAAAEHLQPWKPDDSEGQTPFFRRGSSGEGRNLLTDDEIARYGASAALVAPPDLLAWVHRW